MIKSTQHSTVVRPSEPDAVRKAIVKGLQYLAGICDWAATRDNVGFNAGDAAPGHTLADWSTQAPLTDLELIISWRILWKYQRTQLMQAGIILPAAETVTALFGPDIDIEIAKDRFEGAIRLGLDEQGNEHVIVVFDYSPSKRHRLKQCVASFGGTTFIRNPSGHGGFWTMNSAAVHAVCAEFPGFVRTAEITERLAQPAMVPGKASHKTQIRLPAAGVRSTNAGAAAIPAAAELPLGTIFLDGDHVCVKIERLWQVDRPKALQFKDVCKAYAQQYGGQGYEPNNKYWRIAADAALIVVRTFPQFSQTEEVTVLVEGQRLALR